VADAKREGAADVAMLRSLSATQTVEQLRAATAEAEAACAALEARLSAASGAGAAPALSAEAAALLEGTVRLLVSGWKVRKGMFRGVFDALCEGMEKKPALVKELLGYDIDDKADREALVEAQKLLHALDALKRRTGPKGR